MALPVTISAVAFPDQNYYCGPFLSGGNVYVVLLDSSDASIVEVHKATDPTDSFTEVDSANHPDHVLNTKCMWVFQVGTDLHVAHGGHNGSLSFRAEYSVFHMATDLWDTTLIEEFVSQSQDVLAADCSISIAVRVNGDVIILHNGDHDTVHGTDRARVDYAIRTGSPWTIDVAVDDAGPQDWHGSVIIVVGNIMHFFFRNEDGEAFQRTLLDTLDILETFPSPGDTTVFSGSLHLFGPGISYDDGGTKKVRCPYVDSNGQISYAEFDSSDAPGAFSINANVGDNGVSQAGGSPQACLAVDGLDEHLLYSSVSDGDIYHDKNDGTDDNILAGSVIRLSSNVYDRSGKKLAYIYLTGGGIEYNELDISGAAATSFPPAQPAMRRPLPHVRM